MVTDEELRKKAKKKAKEKIGFYVHFLIYFLVNAFLYAQWFWINKGEGFEGYLSVIPMTVGWGIGVLAHFIGVFIIDPHSERLEEKEYKKLKEKNQ